MARKLDAGVTQIMELDEYESFIHENIDLGDFDCLCETAWALKALANNRSFLSSAANLELRNQLDGRKSGHFTPNSIVFRESEFYAIRANIWTPLNEKVREKIEAPLFSYFNCHDHNFHFVTAAYSGPGYETDLYEYDRSKIRGEIDEKIDLRFVERLRFRTGDLMAYQALDDVHIQHPPTDISVTLNLVAKPSSVFAKRQYFFDVENSTIMSAVENSKERAGRFLEMARHLGDANTIQLLMDLAKSHPSDAIRETARDQLLIMVPAEREHMLARL